MNDAITSNDIAAVKRLLADGSVDVNTRIANLCPLLVLAAELGHVEIVALLLDTGARIDDVDDFGCSAFHTAVRHKHTAVVELLVARNANLALPNQFNETPITIAITDNNERMLMLLIDAAVAAGALDDESACRAAAVSTDVIRLLLFKHRINLSAIRDSLGSTPLHEAVLRRSRRGAGVLDLLIEVAGVDIHARDQAGQTVVHTACMAHDTGTLTRFITTFNDLDLDVPDIFACTPLHVNQFYPDSEITALLLAAGANVHARNNNGRTACHGACQHSHASLPALVAFGANLDELDKYGVTPRQLLKSAPPPTTEDIEAARRRVLGLRLSLVRERAFDVCVALQSIGLDALCMCEILLHSCGPVAPLIAFHRWWQIATTVKHWQQQQ